MKNIIFIAAPASGKGALSKMLEDRCGYAHLALGDVLRQRVEAGDTVIKDLIENGKFVSDELIAEIIKEKINSLKGKPFIIDGCPRTLIQAQMLNDVFEKENINNIAVIKLDVELEVLKSRILGRVICKCGRSYNTINKELAPKVDGVCDVCKSILTKRSDDTEEKIVVRYNEYQKNVSPITEFYKTKDMLYEIDGGQIVETVFDFVKEIIND